NGIMVLTERVAERLLVEPDGRVRGLEIVHRDGLHERIGCETLILACSGFGGNPNLVRRNIPDIANALYFDHPGNHGDAIIWGHANIWAAIKVTAQLPHHITF